MRVISLPLLLLQDPLGARAILIPSTAPNDRDSWPGLPNDRDAWPGLHVAACAQSKQAAADVGQQWVIEDDRSIRPAGNASLCVDVWDCGVNNGTLVDLFACHVSTPACGGANSSLNQQWTVDTTVIQSALPLPGGSACLSASGVDVVLWECADSPEQSWQFNATTSQLVSGAGDASVCLSAALPSQQQVFVKPLANGQRAVALLNRGPNTINMTVLWSQLSGLGNNESHALPWVTADVRDIWLHAVVAHNVTNGYTTPVASHGTAMLLITRTSEG